MNFIKTFLAGLLAFVVGSVVVFFLWLFAILGIVGSLTMEKSVAVLPESVLKIDFSELLTDSPSTNPLAGIDFTTMETTPQLPLFRALRAIEAAASDPRIKGIYLRMNGRGGVTGTRCSKSCAAQSGSSARAASSSSPTTRSIRRGSTTWPRRPTASTCSPKG